MKASSLKSPPLIGFCFTLRTSDFNDDYEEDEIFNVDQEEDCYFTNDQGVNETPGAYREASTTTLVIKDQLLPL